MTNYSFIIKALRDSYRLDVIVKIFSACHNYNRLTYYEISK